MSTEKILESLRKMRDDDHDLIEKIGDEAFIDKVNQEAEEIRAEFERENADSLQPAK